MLQLTRKQNESITLTGGIEFKIIGISKTTVRIGIIAPKEVKIWRTELLGRLKNHDTDNTK